MIDLGWLELPCGPSDPCGGFAKPSFQPRSREEVEQLLGQALLEPRPGTYREDVIGPEGSLQNIDACPRHGRSEDGWLWCALLEETCYEEAGLKPRPGEEARGA